MIAKSRGGETRPSAAEAGAGVLAGRAAVTRRRATYRILTPYLFLAPGMLLYLAWMLYPLLYELYISFFDWNIMPGQTSTFVGLENYVSVLQDATFWLSLRNTVGYTIVTVIGQVLLGLGVALLVHRVFVAKRLFRAIYYLPVVTSWVVVSFLFEYLFAAGPEGLINFILMNVLHIIDQPIRWISQAQSAWIVIYALGIWKGVGWAMVIFLAALQGIPNDLYEAAAIDGAGAWARFRRMTLPLIRRTTTFVIVALIIGGFQVFISVYLITGGGPLHRTEVLLSYMFDQSFNDLHFGTGAAISYILTLIIVAVSLWQLRLNRAANDLEY